MPADVHQDMCTCVTTLCLLTTWPHMHVLLSTVGRNQQTLAYIMDAQRNSG